MKKEEGTIQILIQMFFFSIDEEISRVVKFTKKHGKTEEDLFERKERPREWEKLEIIYQVHTKNKAHNKEYNTAKNIKGINTFGMI